MEATDNKGALPQLTLGQYRVGIGFNPGGHEAVNTLKAKAALFIDQCTKRSFSEAEQTAKEFKEICQVESAKTDNTEAKRCFDLAIKYADDAGYNFTITVGELHEISAAQFEAAAMWAVKGATKPDVPEYLNK